MHNKPLVSIIVPSFNVEPYVKKCLDSIKAQTYDNWECIIVDRPSTKDNTSTVIRRYIKGDKRFRFITQVNKGVSDGRNVGFEAAKGKYVQFTDPDDWLSPKLLELGVQRAEETDAEIVQFSWSNYFTQSGEYIDTGFMPSARKLPRIFSVKTSGDVIFRYGEIHVNSMSKLWRRDFLRQHKLHYPTDLKRAEDLAEVSRLVMCATRMTYLDKVLYYYKVEEHAVDSLSNFAAYDEHSLDFYKAIMIVRENMKAQKLLPKLKEGFCWMAINNSIHALHMSKYNLVANKEIYDCIRSQVLPMISAELKKINPALLESMTSKSYEVYLKEFLNTLQLENDAQLQRINSLELEHAKLRSEVDSRLSVKRSARLLAGNIKRKLTRPTTSAE